MIDLMERPEDEARRVTGCGVLQAIVDAAAHTRQRAVAVMRIEKL